MRHSALVVLFSCVLAVCKTTDADKSSTPPSRLSPFYVGACTHFGQGKGLPQHSLALMKTAGILSLRDELSWGQVERKRGVYTIDREKADVFRRAAGMGIAPLLILDYANPLYDKGDRPRSEEALKGYANYATALAKSFGSQVRFYEVWNEYDIGIGMPEPYRKGGSPKDYVRMLRFVWERLKQEAPHVQIVGGACTSGGVRRGWLEEALRLGMLHFCDIVSVHSYNYSRPNPERTPEAWLAWMQNVDAMVRKYNGGSPFPLFVTEMGWPTHVGRANSTSPELSASYLARLYLLARTIPNLRGVWWYDFQDDGWNPKEVEHNFGVVRPDLTPKPAYFVMADASRIAAYGRFLGRLQSKDPNFWGLRFLYQGQEVWAVWSSDEVPKQVVLETAAPEKTLVVHKLGHRPVERGWGHRPWARKNRGAALHPRQASVVVDHRPVILQGGLDKAKIVQIIPLSVPN